MMRIGSPLRRLVMAIARWWQRPRYASYADMPSWQLVVLLLAAGAEVSVYGPVVTAVWPSYLHAAQSPGAFGSVRNAVTGVGLGLFLCITALIVWYFGNVGWRCSQLLKERWFR